MIELMHGDCLELMKDVPDQSVDMILCDLPYGTTACKWDTVIPFEPLWAQYRRVAKPNAAIVLTASQPFTSALGASNLEWLRYSWYWRKTRATGHLNAKKMPMKDIEDVLVFYACPPTYNPQGLVALGKVQKNSASHIARGKVQKNSASHIARGKVQKNSASDMARGVSSDPTSVVTGGITRGTYVQEATGYPRQVLDFPSEGNTVHPTQKPVALMEYLIRTYTNEGETVMDNCMGSGTTGVACMNTGRKFIGMEQDAKYFEIAQKRIHDSIDLPDWLK